MLKNGDDEIILTGEEYNRLRTNVRRSRVERGRTAETKSSDYNTSRADFANGRLRAKTEKAVTQLASVFEDDDDPRVQTIINQYRDDMEDAIKKGNVNARGEILDPFELRGARGPSLDPQDLVSSSTPAPTAVAGQNQRPSGTLRMLNAGGQDLFDISQVPPPAPAPVYQKSY